MPLGLILRMLGVLRMFVLVLMVSAFVYQDRRSVWKASKTDEESESLLNNGASPDYGATKNLRGEDPLRNGQWLDYFDGFRRLFPYIW